MDLALNDANVGHIEHAKIVEHCHAQTDKIRLHSESLFTAQCTMRTGQSHKTKQTPQAVEADIAFQNWDVTKIDASTQLLSAGFELANFLVQDRAAAVDILSRALEKLKVQSRRELKRLYWRDKHAERPIRRIARSDVDMLQWLIMFEAEQDERAQERAGIVSNGGMAIRYIKHLVQITSVLSSFYVNVGITRLLHNYSTSEAQRIYERLTSRYLGPDEYRRAKSILMEKMTQRFGGFVKTARGDRGELRFEGYDQQQKLAELITDCLRILTPWSTRGRCSGLGKVNGKSGLEFAPLDAKTDQNEIDLRSCHILIEPNCNGLLMEELALDRPETKLALPRFYMSEKQEKNDDKDAQPPRPPELSQEDIDQIQQRLSMSNGRRRSIFPRALKILIDGVEQTRIDLMQHSQVQIGLEMGANLLEVRGEDERGELLLATHIVPYATDAFDYSAGAVPLKSGKLRFEITPIAPQGQNPPRAIVALSFQPVFRWARPWFVARQFTGGRTTLRAYTLSGLAMGLFGVAVTGAIYSHKLKMVEQKLQHAQSSQQQLLQTSTRAIISYRLTRDDQRVRGTASAGIPEIPLNLRSAVISLELPIEQSLQPRSYTAELKAFSGDETLVTQKILYLPPRDGGAVLEIIFPANLLRVDTYYTVYLHLSDRTDHFTFKAVDNR